jgi:hypothetical protein
MHQIDAPNPVAFIAWRGGAEELRISGNDRDSEAVMAVNANSLKRGDAHSGFGCHEIVESA